MAYSSRRPAPSTYTNSPRSRGLFAPVAVTALVVVGLHAGVVTRAGLIYKLILINRQGLYGGVQQGHDDQGRTTAVAEVMDSCRQLSITVALLYVPPGGVARTD